jgi:hypothetical protein
MVSYSRKPLLPMQRMLVRAAVDMTSEWMRQWFELTAAYRLTVF